MAKDEDELKKMLEDRLGAPVEPGIDEKHDLKRKPSEVRGCPTCGGKLREVSQKRRVSLREKQHLVLVTTFASFDSSYSLCSVVADQIRAGIRAGYHVQLWTLANFDSDTLPEDLWLNSDLSVRTVLPVFRWEQDVVNPKGYSQVKEVLFRHLDQLEDAVVITHDLLFQSWFVTYAKAFHEYNGKNPDVVIYHTTHSTVGGDRITKGDGQWRCSLPKGQKLLCLNYTSLEHTRQFYGCEPDDVHCLQNVRDLPQVFGMTDIAAKIIRRAGMLTADVVQVYPYCATRARAKGVQHLLRLFGSLKRLGEDPCLVLVDAHATDERSLEQRKIFDQMIEQHGIEDNVTFVSDLLPDEKKYKGVGHKTVMDLYLASNLFVFPSTSEMSPLTWMEAALAGCLLVGNSDVPSMTDIVPVGETLYYPFGTSTDLGTDLDYDQLACGILDALGQCRSNTTKRTVLRNHSIDNLCESLKLLGG